MTEARLWEWRLHLQHDGGVLRRLRHVSDDGYFLASRRRFSPSCSPFASGRRLATCGPPCPRQRCLLPSSAEFAGASGFLLRRLSLRRFGHRVRLLVVRVVAVGLLWAMVSQGRP